MVEDVSAPRQVVQQDGAAGTGTARSPVTAIVPTAAGDRGACRSLAVIGQDFSTRRGEAIPMLLEACQHGEVALIQDRTARIPQNLTAHVLRMKHVPEADIGAAINDPAQMKRPVESALWVCPVAAEADVQPSPGWSGK